MNRDDIRNIVLGIAGTLISGAALSVLGFFLGNLPARLREVPWAWIVFALLAVTTASWFNLINYRGTAGTKDQIKALAPAVAATTTFIGLLSWGPSSDVGTVSSFIGSFASLLLAQLLLDSNRMAALARVLDEQDLGFAATAVLIDTSDSQDPQFVLVFNRNLRDGRGLFVPPGGHFTPAHDDPVGRLLEKIRHEVGVSAAVVHLHELVSSPELVPPRDFRVAAGARWTHAPVFLLREDMYGRCSHGHNEHHDYVYICTTNGEQDPNAEPKYLPADRILVSVRDCADNLGAAEQAVRAKADQWYRQTYNKTPSVRDFVADDVVWRLHLTARIVRHADG